VATRKSFNSAGSVGVPVWPKVSEVRRLAFDPILQRPFEESLLGSFR
jgi:hypothetical protein